jgi:excisionase family DNA binding protein
VTNNSPVWWNKKQLCEALGYSSPSYVDKLMRQGLPYYKVGRKILFHPVEVQEWLQQYRSDDSQEIKQLVDEALNRVLHDDEC